MSARAWQRMLSGRRLDLLDPSPLDVELSDIAHGLARVARWNGQTDGDHAFSVAQHSLVVEEIFRRQFNCTAEECQMALLHDAPEYVIGDMISPFKAVVGGGYKTIEKRLEALTVTEALMKQRSCTVDELNSFMRCLNDARLVLGTRLDVDEEGFPSDPDGVTRTERIVYESLTHLLGRTVEALNTGL